MMKEENIAEDNHEKVISISFLHFCPFDGSDRLSEANEKRLSGSAGGVHQSERHG